jgi:hypothetical protein
MSQKLSVERGKLGKKKLINNTLGPVNWLALPVVSS